MSNRKETMEFKVTWLDPDTDERTAIVLVAKSPEDAIAQVRTNLKRGGLKGSDFKARKHTEKS